MNTRWILTTVCVGFAPSMVGCSSTLMTADEKEYKTVEMYDEWQHCRAIYRQSNSYWVSRFTSTPAIQRGLRMPPMDEMRRDLVNNRCHAILRETG